MVESKPFRAPATDVPLGVVVGLILCLLAVFVPLTAPSTYLPEGLAPLVAQPGQVLRFHAAQPVATIPPWLLESWETLTRAIASRDPTAISQAQGTFSRLLIDAGATVPSRRMALREAFLRRFEAARRRAEAQDDNPLLSLAARHGLLETAGDEALGDPRPLLWAWFDLRWELAAVAGRASSSVPALENVLQALPAEEQRVLLAWMLRSPCHALVGAPPAQNLRRAVLDRCAALRLSAVPAAQRLDPAYPAAESSAFVEVLRGREALTSAERSENADDREAMQRYADAGFRKALELLEALPSMHETRLGRRILLGLAARVEHE